MPGMASRLDEKDVSSLDDHEISPAPKQEAPLAYKLIAVALVSGIGFGASWGSGITGAMKTTLKKELDIDNTQYSLLSASEDFMVTILILFSGIWTDKVGGASAILYGNIIYTIGSILMAGAAQVRSYKFMIGAQMVSAIGDIATQIAQYKMFSSWFPPNNGFASTLAFELGVRKIGAFVGKSSANIISTNTGNFAWVYWVASFMNIFTNFLTLIFWYFNLYATKRFGGRQDPATGEVLHEKSKKFDMKKVLQLPWMFWAIMVFSLFETSTVSVFANNATELAEQRFDTDSITAGWYTSVTQYAGFFLVPIIGIMVDLIGHRITFMAVAGVGVFISMLLVTFATSRAGTAASFGIYAAALCIGPTVIIDSIRTLMWDHSVFGTAYACKIAMNNAMTIIVNIICGAVQDADNNSYNHVTKVYLVDSFLSLAASILLVLLSFRSIDLGGLQWGRKKRIANGARINERRGRFYSEQKYGRNMRISKISFALLVLLVIGSSCAYIWGAVTGNS